MAIELIKAVWCDPHMAMEEQVPGETVMVALDGGRAQEIELCKECRAKYLGPIERLLEEEGRVKGQRASAGRPTAAATAAKSATSSKLVDCPIKPCPDGYKGNRQNMRAHLESVHNTTLARVETDRGMTLEGEKLNHFCTEEGCGLGYKAPQSLSVHMLNVHGINTKGKR